MPEQCCEIPRQTNKQTNNSAKSYYVTYEAPVDSQYVNLQEESNGLERYSNDHHKPYQSLMRISL